MIRRRHIWRTRWKFSDQFSWMAEYVGYFEIGEYDGQRDVSWCWASYARQDKTAQHWLCGEMARLQVAR